MSGRVEWSDTALRQAERYAKDDPQGVRQVFDATDQLPRNPRPAGSSGGDTARRIHVGLYRIMYYLDDGPPVVVSIEHLGRRG